MTTAHIIQEIREARRDLAGVMQKAERIEAALFGMAAWLKSECWNGVMMLFRDRVKAARSM
ncbi:MAG: hypothetical protein H0S81_07120 [Desulfotignum balticum]|jgi:hypothetical protein|uniref:Uncharacterized protein n=1 Tax=Desulfotignum balticum TaxID=115781 RepID=A0A931CVV2_9BACT|nr:hypothetical protein [Desulfotignum balticum]